jgi:hypothetical protein
MVQGFRLSRTIVIVKTKQQDVYNRRKRKKKKAASVATQKSGRAIGGCGECHTQNVTMS